MITTDDSGNKVESKQPQPEEMTIHNVDEIDVTELRPISSNIMSSARIIDSKKKGQESKQLDNNLFQDKVGSKQKIDNF